MQASTSAQLKSRKKEITGSYSVNFFAAVALLRGVLPGMRLRRQGTIINISSMDGIASLPVNATTRQQICPEGLIESLWQEIEPLGLRAFLVEPGSELALNNARNSGR
jgi:short-subunit dehydrogenase